MNTVTTMFCCCASSLGLTVLKEHTLFTISSDEMLTWVHASTGLYY